MVDRERFAELRAFCRKHPACLHYRENVPHGGLGLGPIIRFDGDEDFCTRVPYGFNGLHLLFVVEKLSKDHKFGEKGEWINPVEICPYREQEDV